MTQPYNTSNDKAPRKIYGRISKSRLLDEDSDELLQDSIESGPISRTMTASRSDSEAPPEEAFQHDMPLPLTGLWRLYSDQMAREGVQNAEGADLLKQAAAAANIPKNKLPATLGTTGTPTTVTLPPLPKHSNGKLPAGHRYYGTVSKAPLIDEDDDDDEDDIPPPPITRTSRRTTEENAVQSDMPPPLTGFWRLFSDQYAREGVQIANEEQQGEAPPTLPPFAAAVRDSSINSTPAGKMNTAFTDTRQDNDNECSIHALAGCNSDEEEEEEDDEAISYSSPVSLFKDTLSPSEAQKSPEKNNTTSYLDPDLVRRASELHTPPHTPPRDSVPKTIHVHSPSHDDITNSPVGKKFVRVHGMRHAKSAIEKGESIIVKCSSCRTKFQVDRKASALYCIHCKSVTKLSSSGSNKKKLLHSI